jgi:hypothetical protein
MAEEVIHAMRASGLEYLGRATELLQRVRLADANEGLWEAADLQWWWRTPRRSDTIAQPFWIDREGPVAGVVLTDWARAWQCDPIVVPGVSAVPLAMVWARALEAIDALGPEVGVEVLARDDDAELLGLLAGAGFVPDDDRSGATWMDAQDRPEVATLRGADEGRGRVPAAGLGPCHAHDRSRPAGEARSVPPEGRLQHRCGTSALRRRRLPTNRYEQVVQPALRHRRRLAEEQPNPEPIRALLGVVRQRPTRAASEN